MLRLSDNRPIVYGEVLFDCFPDGTRILGGAPFNVAWHLQGLGLNPLMISVVGDDETGHTVLHTMEKWGMDTGGMQISDSFPTGQVNISINEGEPAYDIVAHQAYDNIDYNLLPNHVCAEQFSVIYHGSLVRREAVSRDTLQRLLAQCDSPAFVDINLRPPWWQKDDVRVVLQSAQIVKLNIHELAAVMDQPTLSHLDKRQLSRQFFSDYQPDLLIVTLGDEGALLVTPEEIIEGKPVLATNFIDTVGAGDSFSAVMIAGLIKQLPSALLLQRALEFSAAICEIRGATTSNRELYNGVIKL